MTETIAHLLRRQAEWQRAQVKLSWAEKVKIAEAAREALVQLRHASTVQGTAGKRTPR